MFSLVQSWALSSTNDGYSERRSCLPASIPQTASTATIQRIVSRPQLDTFVMSTGKHFRVHFNRSGFHSVSNLDLNTNGIPDYIDSVNFYLEHVYVVEIDSMGFAEPLRYTADSSAWDVYIMEIGNEPGAVIDGASMSGYYGLTYPVETRNKSCGSGIQQSAAFLVLDNNYSAMDSVSSGGIKKRVFTDTGIFALKVTIAHEFHHMIQFAYTASLPTVMINEMTGVWMEHRVFPQSSDYIQYMKPLLSSTDTRYWTDSDNATTAGYAHAFFFQYLQETSQESVVRLMWERFGSCENNVFRGLDSAARSHGSSLATLWKKCLPWLYGTAYRSAQYASFSNAADMPTLVPYNNLACEYSDPSLSITCSLHPFQFRLLRCVVPGSELRSSDTVDVLCTSSNTEAAIASSRASTDVTMVVSRAAQENAQRIGTTPYYVHVRKGDTSQVYDTVFVAGGFIMKQGTTPFPQPYSLRSQDVLWFPLSPAMALEKNLILNIMSVDGVILYSAKSEVVSDAERRIRALQWRPSAPTISSGVYIYTIESDQATTTGSFLIEP